MKKIILIPLFFFAPALTHAAVLFVEPSPANVGVGDLLLVTLTLDSDVSVNAFSGTLKFSSNLIPQYTADGSSIVSVWVRKPEVEKGTVSFMGLTAGGYAGRGGKLFSVLVRATAPGLARVSLDNVSVLRNDGTGSAEEVVVHPFSLLVAAEAQGGYAEAPDTEAPEPFELYFSNEIESGEPVLVFETQDKSSGIDHYEAREWRFLKGGEWQVVESPYRIADRYLTSNVEIRATDRAGNERVSLSPQQRILRPYEWFVVCLILAVCGAYYFLRRRYSL